MFRRILAAKVFDEVILRVFSFDISNTKKGLLSNVFLLVIDFIFILLEM